MKKTVSLILASIMALTVFAGCGGKKEEASAPKEETKKEESAPPEVAAPVGDISEYLKGKTLRIVIGSTSVSGDTYLTADLVSRMISEKYGCTVAVDPIGAGRALEELVSAKDETTLMMFHDMTYLGVLFGAYDEDDYKLENMIVGGSYGFNPGDAFAASASAPYKTIAEMGEWMKENPTESVRLAVEAGGVSQLGFNAIYLWLEETYGSDIASNLKAFVTGSTQEKLQALWDGNCQGIYAAASALAEYTLDGVDDQLKVNIIGLMGNPIEGEDWPTFEGQGIAIAGTPFNFSKEYIAFYNKNASGEFVAAMDAAFEDVCSSQEYIDAIEKIGYKPQFLNSADATAHFYDKRATLETIINNCPSFDDLVG